VGQAWKEIAGESPRVEQREPYGQIVPRPAEATEPRDLSDAGVEAAVEDDIVRSRRP
jgi:hypothetical protein